MELRGRRIPAALRRQMRHEPAFEEMVRTFERDGTLAVDVGERFVATCLRDPGTGELVVVDRLAELLTDAPEPYFCSRCGGEKSSDAEMCTACEEAESAFHRGRWSRPA